MEAEYAASNKGVKRLRHEPNVGDSTINSSKSSTPIESERTSQTPLAAASASVAAVTVDMPQATPRSGVDTRTAKWQSMLTAALMQDRAKEEEKRVSDLALRVVTAIPGSRAVSADTFRVLLVNIRDTKNEELRSDIIEGRLPVEVLVRMNERELLNPEERKNQEAAFLERSKDTDLTEIRRAMATKSTLFQCPSCKARDCSWTQKQTRSADEPMTVFCHCNVCDTKWTRR
ncbi:Transcription factor S II (TFIIS) central domain [Trypanosoma vivax]|uniref:Putative transcription elongation factor n=1 Tax=Trypanosoma vivax (strain Y486) TaxID=1055687 RepID=G0UB38_TRYVY|nr:putative transcription elongation factor [Trypanosoma vivax]KAH8606328.1 Transcription factor S II (TFIIS) central domain [Trypanosoma vivax]CCC53025.1 putative transcription elongation factor [Trypanosoma vivax Y486]